MRATARGKLLLGLAFALAAASLPLQSVAPALVGFALLGLVAAARQGLEMARVRVDLEAPATAAAGRLFLVAARAAVEPPLPVRASARVPPGVAVRALDAPRAHGASAWEAALVAPGPGEVPVRGAAAEVTDALGLWAREVPSPGEAVVRVLPEAEFARRGGTLGAVEQVARGRRAFQESTDVERVRPYQPGDRLRDIDWAHTAKLQSLVTRERNREAPRPIVCLVDATRTMRWRRVAPMTGTSARLVMAMAGVARRSAVPLGAVVYGDAGVLRVVRARRSHGDVEAVAQALAGMPPAVDLEAAPGLGAAEGPLSPAERGFLARLAPFVQGPLPGASPLEAALAAVATASGNPSLVALVTSVDHAPRAALAAVQRLQRKGHLVVVLSPHLASHLFTPEEARSRAPLVGWARRNRAWAAQRLDALGVPLVVVRRGEELDGVKEVVAWAR